METCDLLYTIAVFITKGVPIIIGIVMIFTGILLQKVEISNQFHQKGARITGIVSIILGLLLIFFTSKS